MKVSSVPTSSTGLVSGLISDYLNGADDITQFVNAPFSIQGADHIISGRNFEKTSRETLVDSLLQQYESIETTDQVRNNIESLRNSNCFTVTTGHQLCLATGPMYFIFKIISAVRLSREWNQRYPDRKFVPVYWMATEDHDFAEINHVFLFGKKIVWESMQQGAVGKMNTHRIEIVLDTIAASLGTTEYSEQTTEMLRNAYQKKDLAEAMRYMVNALFGKYGLVIIDASQRELKRQAVSLFRNDLFNHSAFQHVGNTSSELREKGYATKVNPREVNLFFLGDGQRNRIEQTDSNSWRVVDADQVFNKEEIEKLLTDTPEVFSPNVILRPAYQEITLPNVAYIGGPGELAYWMQLLSFFNHEGIAFPLLVLRDSAFLINARMQTRMEKAGVHSNDLFRKKEQVIRQVIERSGVPDLSEEKEKLIALFSTIIIKAKQTDSTLEGAANAELNKQLSSIDGLEKRIFKAAKTREEVKVQQIEKIWQELYPDGTPQERQESILPFIAARGFDFLDELLESFDPMEKEFKIVNVSF